MIKEFRCKLQPLACNNTFPFSSVCVLEKGKCLVISNELIMHLHRVYQGGSIPMSLIITLVLHRHQQTYSGTVSAFGVSAYCKSV